MARRGLIWLSCLFALGNVACGEEPPNLLGLPARAAAGGGALMIAGGGRMSQEVYDRFVELAGGRRAKLVIVPSAYPFSSRSAMLRRYSGWRRVGTARVDYLDADSRSQADAARFAAPLDDATGVWLCGGYQGRLANLYCGTRTERAIRRVVERGGVVGGTSAGAAIMSQVMIRYGRNEATVGEGFALLTGAVVDQHFSQRSRQRRLLSVLKEHDSLVGLGVDEGTALVVEGDRLTVVGRRKATLYLPSRSGDEPVEYQLLAGQSLRLVERAAKQGRWIVPASSVK